jgi:hypothetical protein
MQLNLPVFRIEVATPRFLLKGNFQPRGDILVFLNDRSNTFFSFENVEMLMLSPTYPVPAIKQPVISINRQHIIYVAVTEQERAEAVQVLLTKRPAVFYTEWCAIQGQLHVNTDAPDDDLLSELRDFFAISNAYVFPIRSLSNEPARQAPYVLINRHATTAYHVHKPKGG